MHSDTHAACKQPALPDDPYGILPKLVSHTHLLHYPSLPFGECRVPSQFVVNVFHFDLHTTLGLFAIGRWRFLRLERCIAIVCYVRHGAVLQANVLLGSLVVTLIRGSFDAGARHGTWLHAGPEPTAERAGRPTSAVHIRHLAEESHTIRRPEAGLPRSAGRVHYNLAVRHSNRCADALYTPHRPNVERRLTWNRKRERTEGGTDESAARTATDFAQLRPAHLDLYLSLSRTMRAISYEGDGNAKRGRNPTHP